MQPEDILRIAQAEIGVHETPGPESTKRILEYLSTVGISMNSDEIAWCSAFTNWVVIQAGGKGTNNAMARSWLNWGVKIDNPFPGCITVLKRGNPPSGHVGIFKYRRSPGGWVQLVGGNQSDAVKLSFFQESDVLGYRWVDNIKEAT